MGSASSSNNVKSIDLDQNGGSQSSTNKTKQQKEKGKKNDEDTVKAKSPAKHSQEVPRSPPASPPPPSVEDKSAEIAELTRQLCESESQRLDLEDRVQALEENLEQANAESLMKAEQPCDETMHAKDQYMATLEKEKGDLQTELNKWRQRHKKRLKQHNSQMAEVKQEMNFQIMELKEEIQKLKQDNKKLTDTNDKGNSKVSSQYEDENAPKLPGGEKMKLILELSEQVTEQGDKIAKLEKKMKDKDHTIDELRVKLKNNSEYLKAIDEKKDSARSAAGDRNNNNIGKTATRTVNRDNFRSSSFNSPNYVKPAVQGENFQPSSFNSPKHVKPVVKETEDDFNETAGMKKLTSMLQGTRAKNEVGRLSIDSIDESRVAGASLGVSIVEETSGTGRDSGLGSAGKREEAKAKANPAAAGNNLDWNSLESGLSDSDAEGNYYLQSKIFSAPPKLQGGKNPRLKKKSNSLKKRSSQRDQDRPPRPGLAFVSKTESQTEEKDDFWDGHLLSPIMSPVQVS